MTEEKPVAPSTPTLRTRRPGRYKRQLQTRIAGILSGLFLAWALAFVPEQLFARLTTLYGAWTGYLSRGGVAISMMFFAKWIIFAQDSLATGNSKWSAFFRSFFSDQKIQNKYDCTRAEASALWFRYFNKWEDGPHEYQSYHRYTFSRTYACRLIYHLRQWLLYFTVLGIVTLIANWLFIEDFNNWIICVLALLAALALWAFLTFANAIPIAGDGSSGLFDRIRRRIGPRAAPTGCWAKYQEIAEIQLVHLQHDILDTAATYTEAWQVVTAWPAVQSPEPDRAGRISG